MSSEVMTPQEAMRVKLETLPIPSKEIKVYGSQIMITAHCENTARKWHSVLSKLSPASLRIGRGTDYAKENKGTNLCPSTIEVWRVWASL
jgi:hypothetical protein